MRKIFGAIFKTIYKKKEAKICLLFSMFPLLVIISNLLPTNFMQISGELNAMSCMDFVEAVISVQYQLTLPSIAFMYLAATCIHDEIKKGNFYLYKDIPRIKVFLCKTNALVVWYLIYLLLSILTSIFTYYMYITKQTYASGLFFSNNLEDIHYIVISILGNVSAFVISILLIVVLACFLNNGASLLIGTLFTLFCSIAPSLENVNIIFPTGFLYTYDTIGFCKTIAVMILISVIYGGIIGMFGMYKIRRIEY